MATLHEIRQRIEALRTEARTLVTAAGDGAMAADAETRFAAVEAEVSTLRAAERRAQFVDDLDRGTPGTPVGADPQFDRAAAAVGLLDVLRAGMGETDAGASRAREMSAEIARRSGRQPSQGGILWDMGAEQRVLTTAAPVAGPGSNLIANDFRPDLFVDILRAQTRVRQLGATVLTGLTGNVTIPRRTGSVAAAWVNENSALPFSDPSFDGITMSPKHAGVITEYSRNMILQSSPDVEMLARQDMAAVMAQLLDQAAVGSTTVGSAQPRGIIEMPGIGSVAIGANGGPLTYDAVADLIGQVDDSNAAGDSTGFLTNTKVRRAAAKIKTTQGQPLGLDVIFQGKTVAYSNLIVSNGTKGTGTGLSTLVYGNWADLLIGMWGTVEFLVNPYESVAYSKGNVQLRILMSCDINVRHPQSFAIIDDIAA